MVIDVVFLSNGTMHRVAQAEVEKRSRHADIKLSNPHVAEHAAARAVHELAPE